MSGPRKEGGGERRGPTTRPHLRRDGVVLGLRPAELPRLPRRVRLRLRQLRLQLFDPPRGALLGGVHLAAQPADDLHQAPQVVLPPTDHARVGEREERHRPEPAPARRAP